MNKIKFYPNLQSEKSSKKPLEKYLKRCTPVLRPTEILERMCHAVKPKNCTQFKAFYSSELGGIITEPAFMIIHMDDHMVHRGHSVYDISRIEKGHIYLLDRHLKRFFRSAKLSKISITFSETRIRKIIIETCSASSTYEGEVRFWLSAGRGSYELATTECEISSFYVQVIEKKLKIPDFTESWRIISSALPAKTGLLSQIVSTNSLMDVICLLEAKERCAQQAVFLNASGYVEGSPGMNFLIFTGDKRLLFPSRDSFQICCTVNRVVELVNWFLSNDTSKNREDYEWLYDNIKSAEIVPLMRPQEIRSLAKELFLVGDDVILIPIHKWDDEWVGDRFLNGYSELFQVLYTIIKRDMTYPGFDSSLLTAF